MPASYNFHSQSGCFVGIMDQGQCGSCYAFSTAAAASDRLCLAQNTKRVLSPQEILDCGKGKAWFGTTGCNGGDPYQAALLMKNGYPSSDTIELQGGCRPYTCYSGSCSTNPTCSATCKDGTTATKYKATGATRISGVDNMRLEIYNNGPITAGYDICNSFYTFFNDANNAGKVYSTACSSSSSDYMGGHAVSIVGWGTDANGVAYWLIANSWDTWWADAGYFRIKRGVNLCGIENYVSAPVIARTAKRFGGVTVVDERDFSSSSSFNTGQAVTVDSSNEFVQRSSQLVLDQWFLNNGGANNNASVDPSQLAATGKRAEVPPPSLTTGSSYSVSGVNSATVQVTAGQNVFVDIVATDGVNTVNLVSTVSFGAGGEASSVAVVTVAGGGAGGLGAGAIAGIVVGSVVGAVLLAALTTAVVAGVVAVRRMKSRDTIQEHADEMEEVAPAAVSVEPQAEEVVDKKANRTTWFVRRLMFQSITARSPPIKLDEDN